MSKRVSKIKTAESAGAPRFEDALGRLEKIVEQMEMGELSLEDSLKRYEEGVGLARYCHDKLNEVQKKIEVLQKDAQGQWVRTPFERTGGGDPES